VLKIFHKKKCPFYLWCVFGEDLSDLNDLNSARWYFNFLDNSLLYLKEFLANQKIKNGTKFNLVNFHIKYSYWLCFSGSFHFSALNFVVGKHTEILVFLVQKIQNRRKKFVSTKRIIFFSKMFRSSHIWPGTTGSWPDYIYIAVKWNKFDTSWKWIISLMSTMFSP
jgi:hypothetical protein